MPVLKECLEPTDFADADCRVSPWAPFTGSTFTAYRIWVCKCGKGYWFQRHEWAIEGRNSTRLDDWIFSGYSPYRKWEPHLLPAPKDDL